MYIHILMYVCMYAYMHMYIYIYIYTFREGVGPDEALGVQQKPGRLAHRHRGQHDLLQHSLIIIVYICYSMI